MILLQLTFVLLYLKFAMGKAIYIYLLLCYYKHFDKHFTEVFIELCFNKHMNFDVAIATEKFFFSKPLLYIQVDIFDASQLWWRTLAWRVFKTGYFRIESPLHDPTWVSRY